MAEQRVALDGTQDATVEFFGGPGTMLGTVALRNISSDRVRLRRTVPRVCSDLSRSGPPLLAHVARRAVLDPSAVGQIPVRLRIPRHTAPGDYQVQVDVGGAVHQAVLHVLEDVAVTVSPEEVFIAGGSQPQERRIAVSNDGNVAVSIASFAVPLDDDLLDCRSLRAGAKEFSETGVVFDDFLSAVVRQGNRALERAGILRVRVAEGTLTVQPGETRLATLLFTAPGTLERHTRYTAVVPIATADLQVRVVPGLRSDAAGEPTDPSDDTTAPPEKPAPAPRTPKKAAARKTGAGRPSAGKKATAGTRSPRPRPH